MEIIKPILLTSIFLFVNMEIFYGYDYLQTQVFFKNIYSFTLTKRKGKPTH